MGAVVVAGSINMDVVATADRHPRIGETVVGREVRYFPGGKGANQAVAAARLGASTRLIGRLGSDASGNDLRAFLAAENIDLAGVRTSTDASSGTAVITVAAADNTIVVIPGANAQLSADDVRAAPLQRGDAAVSQFEIPPPTISAFFRRARGVGAITVLNPAPAHAIDAALLGLVDILVLNETELGLLAGVTLEAETENDVVADAARSLCVNERQSICVTLGKRGVIAVIGTETVTIAGRAVAAIDTTGAGDCFVGALAAQLATGAPLRAALLYANTAASICVQRMGAAPSMPTRHEVEAAVSVITRERG